MYNQGEIYFFNLNPSLGTEEKKTRPCVVISNNDYNHYMNTVIVIPISSSEKYLKDQKYLVSPLFEKIDCNGIYGTALLQHIRTIDPSQRKNSNLKGTISNKQIETIVFNIKQFF